ncbi:MAG: short-chain dehydrogenase, partial [SAR116 cluster bacterium]|nr:short-chain dehydrogenase [SAR116 cluster bacterium]
MVDNSGTSALISGGTQGLGMSVAECLIKQGCTKLTITGHNADRG